MKKLLLAFAATLGLCTFGSLAYAGPDTPGDYGNQRPAPQGEEPRSYIPLLPPLPFLPVPTLVVGGHGPAPAVVPVGGAAVVGGVGVYGRPYGWRRRWRRGYGYYRGPGVRVGF